MYKKLPDHGANIDDQLAAWFYQHTARLQLPGGNVRGRDGCMMAALLITLLATLGIGNFASNHLFCLELK